MGDLFLTILDMSYYASIVIIIVLFLRILLKKAPKIYTYLLWSVVLLRLILPFSIESTLSVIPSNELIYENFETKTSVIEKYNIVPVESNTNENSISVSTEQNSTTTVNNDYNSAVSKASDETVITKWLFGISTVWVTGVIILLGYGIITLHMFKNRLHNVKLFKDNVYIVDNINTAFVLGVFSPKIFIPQNLSENELEYIILHEQKHIKRGDYVVKLVSYIALCIHWFNPLVWFAYFKAIEDMEMSCDESVLREMGSDIKKEYSTSLLTFATKEYGVNMPLAFGEVSVKARIKNVLNYKSVSGKVGIGLIIIVVITTIVLFLNPVKTTSLLDVRNDSFKNVILTDSAENIESASIAYYYYQDILNVKIPEENFASVATFLNRVKVKPIPAQYVKTDNEVVLFIVGFDGLSKDYITEFYNFNEDFTKVYMSDNENKTKAYEVVNTKEVKKFFDDMYSSVSVNLDTYSDLIDETNDMYTDFDILYKAKTTLDKNDRQYVIELLNMTPLGKTTKGESVEFTRTGDLKGLTWNIKKTDDFDHVQNLTESVLLAFILIEDLDYFNVNIDDILEVYEYRYERVIIENQYGKDFKQYNNSPEELEQFITEGYKKEDLILTSRSGMSTKFESDLPMDFSTEYAVEEGYYVNAHGKKYNSDIMTKFINDVNDENVKKALVRTINYTTEGDPIITFFRYENDNITVFTDNTRDKYGGDIENTPNSYDANIITYHDPETLGGRTYYYITNLKEISKEEFENGFDGELLYYIDEE